MSCHLYLLVSNNTYNPLISTLEVKNYFFFLKLMYRETNLCQKIFFIYIDSKITLLIICDSIFTQDFMFKTKIIFCAPNVAYFDTRLIQTCTFNAMRNQIGEISAAI